MGTWHEDNKEHVKKHKAEWYQKTKSVRQIKQKNTKLQNRYGISLDEYNKMWADQAGCCAICGTHTSALTKPLCVDHCHTTGLVRGLLCTQCNTALGMAKDNITTLQNMIKYLGGNND
jgi:hypothetical protein